MMEDIKCSKIVLNYFWSHHLKLFRYCLVSIINHQKLKEKITGCSKHIEKLLKYEYDCNGSKNSKLSNTIITYIIHTHL